MINYSKDPSNIVLLTLDMADRQSNVLNHEIGQAFIPVLDHIAREIKKGLIRGIIITSAKKSFLTGGDLDYLFETKKGEEIFDFVERLKNIFRRLETLGVPVVAAINGSALGNGFDLALATHHRIAIDNQESYIGHPEVGLGLMPGGGGIIRILWNIGIQKAIKVSTQGKLFTPKEAKHIGLVHDLATDKQDLMRKSLNWIKSNPMSRQPWDQSRKGLESHSLKDPETAKIVAIAIAHQSRSKHPGYLAPQLILNTIVEAALLDFDTASKVESRYFTNLLLSSSCKNQIQAFWYDTKAIRSGLSRPKGFGKFRVKRIGIIGAGIMGSGIALLASRVGLEVVLKDVSRIIAENGKQVSKSFLSLEVQNGRLSDDEKNEILSRIIPSEKSSDFENCDLVIEAVFENPNLKAQVTREAEEYLDKYSIFGSNTMSLSISSLSAKSLRPKNFVGLHFINPVLENEVVEVISGTSTSSETLARAFDFIRRIKKTPVIVKDTPGFFALRILISYILEALSLILEGHSPALIDRLARQQGMVKGPFEQGDEISLPIIAKLYNQLREQNVRTDPHPGYRVLEKCIAADRIGKDKRRGFYDYFENDNKILWPGLRELAEQKATETNNEEIKLRLTYCQVLEAIRCSEEGIINTNEEINIASIHCCGFIPFKGGCVQYVHDTGIDHFILIANQLEKQYGSRFSVPANFFKKQDMLTKIE